MKYLQLDAVNAVWKTTNKMVSRCFGFVVVKETGFGAASENQLNCLEETGLQVSPFQ